MSVITFGPAPDLDALTFEELVERALAINMALTRRMATALCIETLARVDQRQIDGWGIGILNTCTAAGRATMRLIALGPNNELDGFADASDTPPPSAH